MRLIDADALEKEWCSGCEHEKNKYANCDDCALAHAPTVKPERKKGEWITNKYGAVVCSECKWDAPRIMMGCLANRHLDYDKSDYCWHCGADMRGEQNEHGFDGKRI